MQIKVTLTPEVALALQNEATTNDRSLSYVASKILIEHFATGELPPRVGRPNDNLVKDVVAADKSKAVG